MRSPTPKSQEDDTVVACRANVLASGTSLLFREELETPGYGLYSYLLIPFEPTSEEDLIRVNAVLRAIQELGAIGSYVDVGFEIHELNIIYIPIESESMGVLTESDLHAYDFEHAQRLLSKLRNRDGNPFAYTRGPYIVSSTVPLSQLLIINEQYLFFDLTHKNPRLMAAWTRVFLRQAQKREFWKPTKRDIWIHETRDFLANAADACDELRPSLEDLLEIIYYKGLITASRQD
ncbi:MAG: hypothetical protein O7G85_01750 [Planctomycetota bacterium]|nr:hypothetical protein [Planctomycetota bacterium]